MKVLLAEDDVRLAEGLELLLVSLGHDVVRAHSGREASGCLGRERFDVALVDHSLGDDVSGDVLCRICGDASPRVPVLLMSGHGAAIVTGIGADGHLLKPFGKRQLVDALGRIVQAEIE